MIVDAEATALAVVQALPPDAVKRLTAAAVRAERGERGPIDMTDVRAKEIKPRHAANAVRMAQWLAVEFSTVDWDEAACRKKIQRLVARASRVDETLDEATIAEPIIDGLLAAGEPDPDVAAMPGVNGRRVECSGMAYVRADGAVSGWEVAAQGQTDACRPGPAATTAVLRKVVQA